MSLPKAFDSLLKAGILQSNQFRMYFTNIQELSMAGVTIGNWNNDGVTIWIDTPNLPGSELKSVDFKYFGFPFKLPTINVPTQEMTCKIRCDKYLNIRTDLFNWQNYHSSFVNSTGAMKVGGKGIPNANMMIEAMDDTMNGVVRGYRLMGLFPGKVGEIELTHEDPQVCTFQCTFIFQRWETVNGLRSLSQQIGTGSV
jgi:hypothetical protein